MTFEDYRSNDALGLAELVAHGEVYAAPAKDGGPAQRITETVAEESDAVWSPDSRKLAFVSYQFVP